MWKLFGRTASNTSGGSEDGTGGNGSSGILNPNLTTPSTPAGSGVTGAAGASPPDPTQLFADESSSFIMADAPPPAPSAMSSPLVSGFRRPFSSSAAATTATTATNAEPRT